MDTKITNSRGDFPMLAKTNVAYLDSAATTLKPQTVIDAVTAYYTQYNANVHRGSFGWSVEATERYDDAHAILADHFNVSVDEIIFCSGATEALNVLAASLTEDLNPGDEIVTSVLEHHSNFVPWQQAAKRRGASFKIIDVMENGELDMADARQKITDRTKIVAVTAASNVTGALTPLDELTSLAHDAGAKIIVDGAQHACHHPMDLRKLDVDYYVFSGHKMFGPTGTGGFYGKRELLEKMEPSHFGGGMISEVTMDHSTWNELPYKFEPGTQNIAGALGLAAAVQYLNDLGMDAVEAHVQTLTAYAMERLSALDGVTLYGPQQPERRAALVAFNLDGIHSHDVADLLNQKGVAVRAGHHCAMPLMHVLGISGTVRMSFALYTTKEDIDRAIEAIQFARKTMQSV